MAQQDSKAPVPAFAVGDRVRVTRDGLPAKLGTEFVVTAVESSPGAWFRSETGSWFYLGDPQGHGVWEKFLELVSTTEVK